MPQRRRRKAREDGARRRLPVRLRYLLAAVAVAATGAVLAAQGATLRAWLDRQFPVERVAVVGELRHQAPRALGRWLAERLEGGFFTADLERLQRAVVARPWVREARLRRRWPATLEVTVTEHRAAARWRPRPGDDWRLVSREGAVLRPERLPRGAGLPRLEGPQARLAELRRRLAALGQRLDGHGVTGLAVDSRGDWSARVDGRVAVRFGRHHWDRRLRRLATVDRGWRLLEREVARIDLRYPDGLAVALPEGEPAGREGSNTGGASAGRPG